MPQAIFRSLCLVISVMLLWSQATFAETDVQANEQSAEIQTGALLQFVPIISWSESDVTSWAVVLCLHGIGLHKEVYEPFARQVARTGVRTYAMDLRGFGSWKESQYGNILDLKTTLSDIETVVKSIRRENPSLPVVLLGESMGGAVAIQAASEYPGLVDGVITCVPSGMRYSQKMDELRTAVGWLRDRSKQVDIKAILLKHATLKTRLQETWMTDKRARLVFSPRELLSFQLFMNQTGSRASRLKDIPVLMVQGGLDKLVKASGNADLFRKLGTVDKDLIVLGKSEHLIFEEGQFDEQAVSVISSWLLKHVVASEQLARKRNEVGGTGVVDATVAQKDHVFTGFDSAVQQLAIGHFFLAQGFLRLNDKAQARNQFQQVIQVAPESMLAGESRVMLLTALKPADDTSSLAAEQLDKIVSKYVSPQTAFDSPEPTMIVFVTKWLKRPDIELLVKDLQLRYGSKLNLVKIDADDPAYRELTQQFKIACVPTFLFLDAKNRLMDKRLGCSDGKDVMTGIVKIMPAAAGGNSASLGSAN